jgi:uncharacterized Tic20 family protein
MQHTEDERILASLAHASIVANVANLAGMLVTSLIWMTQRDRSRYVGAHALQALVYQGVVLVISMFLLLSWAGCLLVALLLPPLLRPDLYLDSGPPASFWLALFGLVVPLGFAVLATLYGLYGAFLVYRGRPFRYPLVGRLTRRELGPEPEIEPASAATLATAPQSPIDPSLAADTPARPPVAAPTTAPQSPIDPSLAADIPEPAPPTEVASHAAPAAPADTEEER